MQGKAETEAQAKSQIESVTRDEKTKCWLIKSKI